MKQPIVLLIKKFLNYSHIFLRSSTPTIFKNILLDSTKFCPEYSFYLLDRIDPLWSNIYFHDSKNSQINPWDTKGHILPQYLGTSPSPVQISSKNNLPSFCSFQSFVKEVLSRDVHLLWNFYGILSSSNNSQAPNFSFSRSSIWVHLPHQVSGPV